MHLSIPPPQWGVLLTRHILAFIFYSNDIYIWISQYVLIFGTTSWQHLGASNLIYLGQVIKLGQKVFPLKHHYGCWLLAFQNQINDFLLPSPYKVYLVPCTSWRINLTPLKMSNFSFCFNHDSTISSFCKSSAFSLIFKLS